MHHSDHWCQYAAAVYRHALKQAAKAASPSQKACCYVNADMEAWHHTLKV